jgi:glycerophosphoryl diester phosphodiesterase
MTGHTSVYGNILPPNHGRYRDKKRAFIPSLTNTQPGNARLSVWIIGHRGAKAEEPENTLRSLQKGSECADYVEVDIRLSYDRVAVIIHDAKLDRTTSGTGRVNDLTLRELKILDAGEGEKIPTLEEVLDLILGKCGLFIEVKELGSEEAICSLIGKRSYDRVFIVSFHDESLITVKKLLPGVKTGFIYSEIRENPVELAGDLNADAIIPRLDRLSRDLVSLAHQHHLLVFPWTPNKEKQVQKALNLGADGIITDDPCMARRYLKSK